MSNQLDPIKALLSEFISQLEERKLLYERNWPAESLTDIWRKEEAYCWVFADLHYQPFSRESDEPLATEKDQWLLLPENEIYSTPARIAYDQWIKKERYIQQFKSCSLRSLPSKETLRDFLLRVWNKLNYDPDRKTNWQRFLRNFIEFL